MLAGACGRGYTGRMKVKFLPLALCAMLALPVLAQDDGVPPTVEEENAPQLFDLFERMLRGFMRDVEPQMRELERGFSELEPELQRFLQQLRDMTQYHPPEVLPNGDILIRRRGADDVPPETDPDPDQDTDEGEARSAEPFEL